jgi:hypothetical protein
MKEENKNNNKPLQTYNPEEVADEVMAVESQYVTGDKYSSRPISKEE